jgi:OmpA-OmpF porin, OOP family
MIDKLASVLTNLLVAFAMVMVSVARADVAHPLGEAFAQPKVLSKLQSRLVVYRSATEKGPSGVATIYIDGVYHASLQRGAFAEVCLPPRRIEVSAVMLQNGVAVPDALDIANTLNLQLGQYEFVRVLQQSDGRAVLMAVRPELAFEELKKTHRQLHTISRVESQACKDEAPAAPAQPAVAPPAPPAAPQPDKPLSRYSLVLEADAVFAFGKSDMESIPLKGRRVLDRWIGQVRPALLAGTTTRIQVVGHADGFGPEAGNLRLSKERAEAIKKYLVQGGLPAERINAEGRGFKERVVTNCGVKFTPANVACNKPNRRVALQVLGG